MKGVPVFARHLTASILYRKEYGQSFIQAVLRHKSPTTTARYLRSLGVNDMRVALNEGLKRECHPPDAVLRPDFTSGLARAWVV